jgi:hypothetical protein
MNLKKTELSKKIVIFLIILITIYTIFNFYRFYLNNFSYEFDPWLSNYQGGFVRRGMPGELFYQIYNMIGITPDLSAFVFVSFLYIFFFWFLSVLIKSIKTSNLILVIIFSPLALFFSVINSKATGHKEIIFFAALAIIFLLINKLNKKNILILISCLMIILGASYEAIIFYFLYLISPFFLFKTFKNYKEIFCYLTYFACLSFLLLLINFFFKGSEQIVNEICLSIKQFVNQNCSIVGKIADLSLSVEDHTIQKTNAPGALNLFEGYSILYSIGFLYGYFGLLIILFNSNLKNKLLKNINLLILFSIFFLFTFPVYYFGADWGRYLYISNISAIIILFSLIKNKLIKIKDNKFITTLNKIPNKIFIIFIFLYSLSFSVPICCQSNFKLGLLKIF